MATDWAAYDKALIQRGSVSFWISDDAIDNWEAKPNGKPGGQLKYTDLAIETALSLRLIFKQGLRQTEGFVGSIFDLMGLSLEVPDHSTLSRRNQVIDVSPSIAKNSSGALTVIVDSTGLKINGAGEWSETKHGLSKRRVWRKLHLTIDGSTLEIIGSSLTDNHVGDVTEAPKLLEKIDEPVGELLGDGAYDSQKTYDAARAKSTDGKATVTVPPKKNAVLSKNFPDNPTQRDGHVNFISSNGRRAWETMTSYYRRLLVENTMGRYKAIIGPILRAINFSAQKVEMQIACKILNKMIRLGTPLRPNLVLS